MKTILSLLLLPVILLAQPQGHHQSEPFDIEFSIDFIMESTLNQENDFLELEDGTIELFVTVEVYVREIDYVMPQFTHDGLMVRLLPKYLNTFSLTGLSSVAKEDQGPQERLNRLLALNDPMFPKEDTLQDWLQPVKYQQNKLDGAANIPEGFGPRISL